MISLIIPKLPFIHKEKTLDYYSKLGFELMADYDDYLIAKYQQLEIHFFSFETLIPEKSDFMIYLRIDNGIDEFYQSIQNQGIEKFKKTQDLNKFLLEKNIIKKEDKIYLPTEKYSNLLIIEIYKGKPSGIKFNNDFISWIEKEILSIPIQGELF